MDALWMCYLVVGVFGKVWLTMEARKVFQK